MGTSNRDAEHAAVLFSAIERMARAAVVSGMTRRAASMAVVMLVAEMFGPDGRGTFDKMLDGCLKSKEPMT